MTANASAPPAPGVLVVEDEWYLAIEMSEALRSAGIEVLGPVGTVADALALIEAAGRAGGIGAALLDVNLHGELVTPVADALTALGVPFVYVTGYSRGEAPGARHEAPLLEKPVGSLALLHVLRAVEVVGSEMPAGGARTWVGAISTPTFR